jgi:type VI secretion system protein VasG
MLSVEPRSLLRKLNPSTTRALEAAASACVSSRHYEVTVEHLLASLLDDSQSDVAKICLHFGVAPDVVRAGLLREVAGFRKGNAGKPVFSSLLLEWIQDAWILASAERNESSIRSGHLFIRLLLTPERYTPSDLPDLRALPREEVRQRFEAFAADSVEQGQPVETGEAAAPGQPARMPVAGDGALDKFTTDLTERARSGALDPIFGREHEIRQVIEILVRKRKNNPIIVGEAGVGKTALVEGLALRIAEGTVPDQLKQVRVLTLDLGSLQAGSGVRGEFESRLKGVIDEVKASPQPIVLFIDEAHTLIGAGGPQGGGDAANLLKPALARGELRTVAATTYAEFKRYFEKDAALERRFQPVRVEEPSQDVAILMMRGLARRFEAAHGVLIRDEAVRAAVSLSSRYISGRQLPDKAVDVLDTSAAYVNLLRNAPPAVVEDTRAELEAVRRELEALDRDSAAGIATDADARTTAQGRQSDLQQTLQEFEQKLALQRAIVDRIIGLRKEAASDGAAEDTRARLSAALAELHAIPVADRLVAADVDEAIVSSVVADWTGVPVGKMVADDVQGILALEERLTERVKGQSAALTQIAVELRSARSGLKPPNTPLGVFLLVGPSGVGKTETALSLADLMFGGERFMVTINMSEFQERHTVSRLIGSPPGYVGFGEGGVLTEAVRHRPYSVVLLDEVEKADKEVLNLFYQVFDKGMLSDGEGRLIDFKNTVIVLTSNLATDLITQAAMPDRPPPDYEQLVSLVKPTLSAYFKPALLARMTVIPYVPIRPEALREIARHKLSAVVRRAWDSHRITLRVSPAVIDAVADRCREVESGARNIDHILRGSVLPLLSSTILRGMMDEQPASVLDLELAADGAIVCVKGAAP